jgi:phosphoenolpyruvate synthase/pyruvate phosphate dikinase
VQQQKTYRQQVLPDKWSLSNISGIDQLLDAIHGYVSLFTNRAIKYRHDMGFTKLDIAISVGVQQMVRMIRLLQVLPLLLILILVFKIRS